MSLLKCISVCLFLLVSEASAQISGTYKVSKNALVEQVTFNADKTADFIYRSVGRVLQGGLTKFEMVTNEVRGTYFTQPIEERITNYKKHPLTDETSKLVNQLIEFKGQSYDLYVVAKFKKLDGTDGYLAFVRKGSELVDITTGFIYRKPFFSF